MEIPVSHQAYKTMDRPAHDPFMIGFDGKDEVQFINLFLGKTPIPKWSKFVIKSGAFGQKIVKDLMFFAPLIISEMKRLLMQAPIDSKLKQTAQELRTSMFEGVGAPLRVAIAQQRAVPVLNSLINERRTLLRSPATVASSFQEAIDLVFPINFEAQQNFTDLLSLSNPSVLEPALELFNRDDPELNMALYEQVRNTFAATILADILLAQLEEYLSDLDTSDSALENYVVDSLMFHDGRSPHECIVNFVETLRDGLECLAAVDVDNAVAEIRKLEFFDDNREKLVKDVLAALLRSTKNPNDAQIALTNATVAWLVPTSGQLQVALVNAVFGEVFEKGFYDSEGNVKWKQEDVRNFMTSEWMNDSLSRVHSQIKKTLSICEGKYVLPKNWRCLVKSLEGLRALPKEELAGLCHLYTLLEKTKIPEGEPVVEVSLRSSLDRLTPMSDNLHITSDLTTATEQDFQVELQTWLRQDVSQKITLLLDLSRSDFIRTLNKALRKHPNIAARITCLRNRQRGTLSKEFNSLVTTIKEVQELDLSKIELISETAVKAISNLPKVSKLSLANSKLQKSSNLSLLAHMPLQKLDLTHTGIGRKPTQGFLRQLNHMHPNTSLELTMAGEKFSSHKLSEVCKTLKLQVISSANYLPQDSAFRTLGFRKTLESTA